MSKKKLSQDELIAQAEAEDLKNAQIAQEQAACGHWKAYPTEWWWSGQVREMTCPECHATNYFDEDPQ